MGRERVSLPRDFPDRAIREALTTPANLRTAMRRAVPALADRLDYARREVVSPSFLLDDWREPVAVEPGRCVIRGADRVHLDAVAAFDEACHVDSVHVPSSQSHRVNAECSAFLHGSFAPEGIRASNCSSTLLIC